MSLNSGISLYSEKYTVLWQVGDWMESEVSWERFILARYTTTRFAAQAQQ